MELTKADRQNRKMYQEATTEKMWAVQCIDGTFLGGDLMIKGEAEATAIGCTQAFKKTFIAVYMK